MRLANRVLLCALAIFILGAVASAQTLRNDNDPRNQSPSVGTGGSEGGPTGLFTVYDGETLRRGEFSFAFGYSNFHRDPGNVHILEVPISLNIGLNDHLELFFKTNAYRGIKVNNPQNLSSFYLPNSQLKFPFLGSGPAIVLAPNVTNLRGIAGTALFRPAFNQPFVQFPFVGGSAGNFGLGAPGTTFGCPTTAPCVFTLGAASGGNNTFGPAGNFPGIGSTVGSILPGIVLATTTLPATALTNPIVVPTTFTIAPSYLPDAPFINRLYGQSSFTNIVIGGKWRLTGPNNPLGVALIPFWRWWLDKANDFKGFNDLQRGAGPGGNIGDFGLTLAVSGRLSRSVNVSANTGYILNSNPKSSAFGGGSVALLDRPDEWISGVGFDFPINKHFQPIAEFRSTKYVGSHTPNALPNNPVEFLAGTKIYPRRWLGMGFWYRRQLNYQRAAFFNKVNASTQIQQVTNVFVPGRGIIIVPGTTRPATANGLPLGFVPSDDPSGYGAQFFFGRRNARAPAFLPNQPPVISSFTASKSTITLPCPPGQTATGCPTTADTSVSLTTSATDPDGDTLLYSYTVTGGRITGEGPNVNWDLSGLGPGTYTATVEVDDGCGCIAYTSTSVTVANCAGCVTPCPTVSVSCPDSVPPGTPITFTANVSGGPGTQTYSWSVSAGTITSGAGTSSITVDTTGQAGQTITATVELGGLDPSCGKTASCSTGVGKPPEVCRKFDEYGNIRFNDEKARLDNFAVQLQNEPTAQGYIIVYGSCTGEGQARGDRAKNYLVNTRGIDAGRLTIIDGGCMSELKVELWICPQAAAAPTPSTTGTVPCPDCKKRPVTRRHRRGEEDE